MVGDSPKDQGFKESIHKSFDKDKSSPEGLQRDTQSPASPNDQEASNFPTEAISERDLGSRMNSSTLCLSSWTPTEILESIQGSIDWLQRLSNLVRSTGFDSQKCRIEGTDVPSLEGQRLFFEYLVARELKWPRGEHPMSKRLVDTMIKRRRLYLFRYHQKVRWRAQITNNELQGGKKQSSLPESPSAMSGKVPGTRSPMDHLKPPNRTTTFTPSDRRRQAATVRVRSMAPSVLLRKEEQTLIPPRPGRTGYMGQLECPYCRLILQERDIATHAAWS